MGIREDFSNYWDGNSLLCNEPIVPINGQKGSDNGTLFTSEYYIILKKNNQLIEQDKTDWANKIGQCIDLNGLLNRVPIGQNDGLESVDDYYGTLSAAIELGNTDIPRKFLNSCIKYKGSMDNVSPGTWQWQDFLIRQPQLLCCMINSSFPSLKNPLHWLLRIMFLPLYLICGFIIAFSNMGDDPSDSTSRILTWLVRNNLKRTSLACFLGSFIWNYRLKKTYPNGMKDVAGFYFIPNGTGNNPYSKWWVD